MPAPVPVPANANAAGAWAGAGAAAGAVVEAGAAPMAGLKPALASAHGNKHTRGTAKGGTAKGGGKGKAAATEDQYGLLSSGSDGEGPAE